MVVHLRKCWIAGYVEFWVLCPKYKSINAIYCANYKSYQRRGKIISVHNIKCKLLPCHFEQSHNHSSKNPELISSSLFDEFFYFIPEFHPKQRNYLKT